jgi:hypothetical protein
MVQVALKSISTRLYWRFTNLNLTIYASISFSIQYFIYLDGNFKLTFDIGIVTNYISNTSEGPITNLPVDWKLPINSPSNLKSVWETMLLL